MTPPLRRSLLNTEISLEARRIAHEFTQTCNNVLEPTADDYHTMNCNKLKHAIENLCLQIKCARSQPPAQPEYPADHPAPGDLGTVPL